MTRDILDRKIRHLLDELLVIDSMVENATIEAIDALKNHDLDMAQTSVCFDQEINARRFDLENEVIITIATQQPIMAGDLRLIASILEVVGELERMGDYAKGIAKICADDRTRAAYQAADRHPEDECAGGGYAQPGDAAPL